MRSHLLAVALAVGLVTSACGDDTTPVETGGQPPAADPAQRYTATATVLESPTQGPQLCLGGIATSLPPQCGGPDIVGWDWDDVEGAESAAGTTWGTWTVVGTYDGERFTLTERPRTPDPAATASERSFDFSTPCPEPAGGWVPVDPATTDQAALDTALAVAQARDDFAGAWVDQSVNPATGRAPVDEMAMNDPALLVLNIRVTGDTDSAEDDLRRVWGGSLCVSAATRTVAELQAIQAEIHGGNVGVGAEQILFSSVDEVTGTVEVGVILGTDAIRTEMDRRFGAGVVVVHSALTPVED